MNETRRKRGRPSAGVREAILAAALELLSDEGLASLTTREVARRARVSEASVFYHFQDKAGLLQQVIIDGLTPLRQLEDSAEPEGLAATLTHYGEALEAFYDHAMPVISAVQADTALRHAFAGRLVEGDIGPHRGVQLLAGQLTAIAADGQARTGVNYEAAALMLIGACFLRSWERLMAGAERAPVLPALSGTVATLTELLAVEPGSAKPGQGLA
jgi:AcrR family transcriptional regulator